MVSSAETLIMRRASVLEAELERLEGIFAAAGEADNGQLGLYQTVANTQRRLLEAVGLERRARNVTPSLMEYAAEVRRSALGASGAAGASEQPSELEQATGDSLSPEACP